MQMKQKGMIIIGENISRRSNATTTRVEYLIKDQQQKIFNKGTKIGVGNITNG